MWGSHYARAIVLISCATLGPLVPVAAAEDLSSPQHVVLSPSVRQARDAARPDDMLELIIVLREQPGGPISREVRARIAPRETELTQRMQAVSRRVLQRPSMPPAQERLFVPPVPAEAEQAARIAAARELDDLRRDAAREIFARLKAAQAPGQATLVRAIEGLGGQVVARMVCLSALAAKLPAKAVDALAGNPLVADIDLDWPGEPELDVQRQSLGLESGFWAGGIDGGVFDAAVLDTGVQQNHPALSSHPFISNMGPADTSTHGTRIAGVFASTDATYRGLAFGLDTIVVSRAGSISTSMPGLDFIASTGEPENTNYSFSNGIASDGDYTSTDRFFDAAIDMFGFMVSKSTGNGGYSSTNLTITHPAPAYNLLASANMDDKNTVTRDDDRITSSSSVGPTLGGRKKPDITAPGNNTMSTNPSGGFANIGGTSAASPHTGAGVILLFDLGLTDVLAAKAVLLNTTDPMTDSGTSTTTDDAYVTGSFWNRRYGWGYLNLAAAYLHGLDAFVDEVPDSPETADHKFYVGQMFDKERATLVWQRHVAYAGAMFPTEFDDLSNLDLFAYREADGGLLSSSTSSVDNVEQLHVNGDGAVVLKVESSASFDPAIARERFALATQENFQAALGPAFDVSVVASPGAPGFAAAIEAHIMNSGDTSAHGVLATLAGAEGIAGPNPALAGTIPAGRSATVSWTAQTLRDPVTVAVLANSYGEAFTGTGRGIAGPLRCLADLNGDHSVSGLDLAQLLARWSGASAYTPCPPFEVADLNQDCLVSGLDLAMLLATWGPCP